MINLSRQSWIALMLISIVVLITIFFPSVFINIGKIMIIFFALSILGVLATWLYFRTKEELIKEGNGVDRKKIKIWPLPNGVQIAIFVITLFLLFILRDKEQFYYQIWNNPSGQTWFLLLTIMALTTAFLPLGTIINPRKFARIRNIIIIICLVLIPIKYFFIQAPKTESSIKQAESVIQKVKDLIANERLESKLNPAKDELNKDTVNVVQLTKLINELEPAVKTAKKEIGYKPISEKISDAGKKIWPFGNGEPNTTEVVKKTSQQTIAIPPQQSSFSQPRTPSHLLSRKSGRFVLSPGDFEQTNLFLEPGDRVKYTMSPRGAFKLVDGYGSDLVVTKSPFYTRATYEGEIQLQSIDNKNITVNILITRG